MIWIIAGAVALMVLLALVRRLGRTAATRQQVLEEVRRMLRGGLVENTPGRGPQARGRLGQLEITVDMHQDAKRTRQSPMWRVLAVGPVRIESPLEVRVDGWQGWIDPWMQLAETRGISSGVGPTLELHGDHLPELSHPVLMALRRQGPALGRGALYARPDLMRAEIRCGSRPEENRPLFAYLQAMAEVSESTVNLTLGDRLQRLPRIRVESATPER